jgi:DNA-binding transcriptional regulator LsrR (DeoR family)
MLRPLKPEIRSLEDAKRSDELRLIARVARMYYTEDLRQPEIASRLDISQARVSRLLKRAQEEGVVRIQVNTPAGVFTEIEDSLQRKFGLKLAIVADAASPDDDDVLPSIGAAAAYYLETTLRSNDLVGIMSWSQSLLATVDAMYPVTGLKDVRVLQILGGIGDPAAPVHASWLTNRLASLVHGSAIFLPSPGIAGSLASAEVLREDPFVQRAISLFAEVTVALVGVGTPEPSRLLASSGNVFSAQEIDDLLSAGAVGDVCLRFFDSTGRPLTSPLIYRVIGISLDQLARAPRCVAVAGGSRKHEAIRAALDGRLVNVLITDRHTAVELLS